MSLIVPVLAFLAFLPALWSLASNVWRRPERISTPSWLASANTLFVFGGPLVTALFMRQDNESATSTWFTMLGVVVAYYAALWGVYTLLWGVVFRGLLGPSRGVSAFATLHDCLTAARPATVLGVSAVLIGFTVILNALYGLSVSGGSDYFKMARLPYPVIVVNTLTGPALLGLTAALSWLMVSRHGKLVRVLAGALVLILVANTLASGRRELIYVASMIGLGVLWSGRRRVALAVPLVAVTAYVILFVFSPVFLRARLIWSGANSPGVVEAFRIAASEQRDAEEVNERTAENLKWRFQTLGFWGDMYSTHQPGAFDGQILAQGAMMVLPRALVGFWKYGLGAVDESIMGTIDICNNLALESWLDLGFLGPVIYGGLIGFLFALADFLVVVTAVRSPVIAMLSCSYMIRLLVGPEVNLISLFSDFRSVLIYFLLAALVAIVSKRKPIQSPASTGARSGRWRGRQLQPVVPWATP